MKKNFLILLLVIAALGVAVVLVQDPFGWFRAEKEGLAHPFEGVNTSLWATLEIHSSSEAAELARDGDNWKVKSLRDFPADPNLVKNLLGQLDAKETAQVTSRNKEKYDVFQVGESSGVALKAKDAGGNVLLDLIVGKYDTGGGTYIRLAGRDEVLRITKPLRSHVRSRSEEWINKRMFEFARSEMDTLTVEWGGKKTVARRVDDSRWDLLEPTVAPGDPDVLNVLASNLAGLSFKALEPEGAAWSGTTAKISAALKDGRRHELEIHREGKESDYRGRAAGKDYVVRLNAGTIDGFDKKQEDFYEKRLLRISPDDITEFTIEEGGTVTLKQKADSTEWEIAAPEPGPAKSDVARDLCSTIANAKADSVVFDEAKKGYGFKDARMKTSFVLKDGTRREFRWGSLKGDSVKVTREDAPLVFTVSKSVFEKMQKKAADFKP